MRCWPARRAAGAAAPQPDDVLDLTEAMAAPARPSRRASRPSTVSPISSSPKRRRSRSRRRPRREPSTAPHGHRNAGADRALISRSPSRGRFRLQCARADRAGSERPHAGRSGARNAAADAQDLARRQLAGHGRADHPGRDRTRVARPELGRGSTSHARTPTTDWAGQSARRRLDGGYALDGCGAGAAARELVSRSEADSVPSRSRASMAPTTRLDRGRARRRSMLAEAGPGHGPNVTAQCGAACRAADPFGRRYLAAQALVVAVVACRGNTSSISAVIMLRWPDEQWRVGASVSRQVQQLVEVRHLVEVEVVQFLGGQARRLRPRMRNAARGRARSRPRRRRLPVWREGSGRLYRAGFGRRGFRAALRAHGEPLRAVPSGLTRWKVGSDAEGVSGTITRLEKQIVDEARCGCGNCQRRQGGQRNAA